MSSRGVLSAIHDLFLICQLLSVFIVIFPHFKRSKTGLLAWERPILA